MLTLVRTCAWCPRQASGCCSRCQLPACPGHRPGIGACCHECERTYRRHRPRRALTHLALSGPTLAALVTIAAVVQTGAGFSVLGPLFLLAYIVPCSVGIARQERDCFVAERLPSDVPQAIARLGPGGQV